MGQVNNLNTIEKSGSQEYEININQAYQENNKRAWMEFQAGILYHPPTDEVLQGWERCRMLGVNPAQKYVKHLLSPYELEKYRREHALFLEVSHPMMENLYEFVSSIGFVIALSDSEGWLLDTLGSESLQNSYNRGNWRAGADWSESSAGNNIIGTAIYLDKPVMIIGYEHYCRCSHGFAGAGAPIHDADHHIIGAISMAGSFEKVHPHTLGMIVAAAKAIELQMDMKRAMLELDVANRHKSTIVNTVNDGLIGTDANDIITFSNDKAAHILQMKGLTGCSLREILSETTLQDFRAKAKGSVDKETLFHIKGSYIKCICSCRHIINDGKFNGMVLVLTEFSRAERLANKMANRDTFWTVDNIIGKSAALRQTLETAKRAAKSDGNILLLGESGSGKDVFAQAIHNASNRRNGPYVAINCAALPKELISSELFGYSDGAFTGAKKGGNKGKVEMANGGTLFLDEIGEMPLEQQAIFLRLLENHSIQKIGSGEEIRVDVRVIAATNKDLFQEVSERRFRQDLYYRLNLFMIFIPPLRDRIDDIPDLARSFLDRLSERIGIRKIILDDKALKILMDHYWPGNIRELQNVLERAYTLSDDNRITANTLFALGSPSAISKKYYEPVRTPTDTLPKDSRNLTITDINSALEQNQWNISKACLQLGISRPTMYRKMELFGIENKHLNPSFANN